VCFGAESSACITEDAHAVTTCITTAAGCFALLPPRAANAVALGAREVANLCHASQGNDPFWGWMRNGQLLLDVAVYAKKTQFALPNISSGPDGPSSTGRLRGKKRETGGFDTHLSSAIHE